MDPRNVATIVAVGAAFGLVAWCRWRVRHAASEIAALSGRLRATSLHHHRDPLTQLLNRRSFDELGTEYLEQHADEPLVAILVDIDNFWRVNEAYGYAVGDMVLKVIAGRICDYMASAVVARLGSNTFAALAPLRDQVDERTYPDPRVLAGILGTPLWAATHWITVTASVAGVRLSNPTDIDSILGRAEASLRRTRTITALSDNHPPDR
jgi:diguanylate cyclase